MKKSLIFILVLLTQACSSIHDIPVKDKLRGDYLFNQKLKTEYVKFFSENVFKNGMYVYAGPTFLMFNNFQMIKLDQLGPTFSGTTIYNEVDGTQHEYHSFTPLKAYYGEGSAEGERKFLMEFSAQFKAFHQTVPENLNLVGTIRCKKNIQCHLMPDIDFALFEDPYDISLKLEEEDKIISENVELQNFSDRDATFIANRMIYVGMDQKAAELAIGKSDKSRGIAYLDVVFKDGKVASFKFGNYNYDLHYFNRY